MKLDVSFNAAALLRGLDQLPDKSVLKVRGQAVRAGARVTLSAMKRLVPVDKGDLKRSLTVAASKGKIKEQTNAPVVVVAKHPDGAHAHLVEFGTARGQAPQPFMRPAISSSAEGAITKMGQIAGKAIEREAAKLGVKK